MAEKSSASGRPRARASRQTTPPPARKPVGRPRKKSASKKSRAPKNPTPAALNPRALSRLNLVAAITATRLTSLSSATIGNWIAAGCPRNADGTFDIVSVAAWLAAERRNRGTTDRATSKALERFRDARAKLTELQLRIRTGELVEHDLVIDQFREIGLGLRNAFASIERRHGRAVGDEIRSALDNAFRTLGIEDPSKETDQ